MRLILILTVPLLLAPCAFLASADTQSAQDALPRPADYPTAGPHCKRKVKVSPWIGTPAVDFPKTIRCELEIHTCNAVKKYTSSARPSGPSACDDYRKVLGALANREICCDQGSREETQSSEKKSPGAN